MEFIRSKKHLPLRWIFWSCLFLFPGMSQAAIDITYVGNEGFLIVAEDKKILVDALYGEGLPGYVIIPQEIREKMEKALPPFQDVDLILATHSHADHFDAQAVANHLLNNTHALFVSTDQAVGKLEKLSSWKTIQERVRKLNPAEGKKVQLEWNEIQLEILSLHHGREVPVQNLGFLIGLDGKKLLHVGDTAANQKDFEIYDLVKQQIDILFIPFWYLTDSETKNIVPSAIHPKRIVIMHVPPPDAKDEYVDSLGGWGQMLQAIQKDFPQSYVFREEMTTMNFP